MLKLESWTQVTQVHQLEPNYYFFPLGSILYLLVYKSTFHSLKITPKNCLRLIHGSKTEIKKSSGRIFHVTIVYLKENSKIREVFQENSYPEIRKTYFLAPKWGVA